MNNSLQDYAVFLKGGVITIGIAIVLSLLGFVYEDMTYINIYAFIFCWLLMSLLVYRIPIYKIIGIVVLFIATMAVDNYMAIPDNPITFPLMILFWLGVAYLMLPKFFKKYRIAIVSVYGAVSFYFLFSRMMPNYLEDYRQNFVHFLVIPIPFFVALWGYEQWRWLKTLEVAKGKAELALLKSQINPHFFFNTLNNLYGLVIEQSDQAPAVILKLSDMMRYTIYEGKEDTVLMKDEISYLENYIELHKIRYRKKVDIKFDHDVADGLKVAPLLFIILLENAFKHGVEKMRENAFIHLRVESIENRILFRIENSFDEAATKRPPGIGLDNLKKRLAYLYPDKHELTLGEKGGVYAAQLNIDLS